MTKYENKTQLQCSFCGKTQDQVKRLIAGPNVYICDECITLCNEIISDEMDDVEDLELEDLPKPDAIAKTLNEYVIGQERAKRVLSVACLLYTSPSPRDRG